MKYVGKNDLIFYFYKSFVLYFIHIHQRIYGTVCMQKSSGSPLSHQFYAKLSFLLIFKIGYASNLRMSKLLVQNISWSMLFSFVAWFLCGSRNKFIFEKKNPNARLYIQGIQNAKNYIIAKQRLTCRFCKRKNGKESIGQNLRTELSI